MTSDPTSIPLHQAAAAEIRGLLLNAGEDLSPIARAHILGFVDQGLKTLVFDTLLSILEDREILYHKGTEGWATLHAAILLGELGDSAAVEPLVRISQHIDPLDCLDTAVADALKRLAPTAVEHLLQLYEVSGNIECRQHITHALASAGVKDERIFQLLISRLGDEDESLAAHDLVSYGDPAALPHLSDALDRYQVNSESDSLLLHQDAIELIAAIRELGGSLTPTQDLKGKKLSKARREWVTSLLQESTTAEQGNRRAVAAFPGRNESCWCGSGLKYKKCHLRSDEEGRADQVM